MVINTNFTSTQRRASQNLLTGIGDAYPLKVLPTTIELPFPASAGETIDFGRIPSNARLCGVSTYTFQTVSGVGPSTLNIGLVGINNSIPLDDDAINSGIDLTADSTGRVIANVEDISKRAWEFMGLSADPGGAFMVVGTIVGNATTIQDTLYLEIYYTLD